jgi:hypothetical protein
MRVIDQSSGNNWTLYHGDCVDVVGGMPESSVHYSVFSPPFASLYTYSNSDRDMGNCPDGDTFARHFAFLVGDLLRVTMPGRLVSFHCMNLPTSKAKDGYIGLRDFRGEMIAMFVEAGWIYHSEVCIWKDPVTAMQRTKALGLLHKQIKKDSCMSRQGIADYLVTMRKPGDNPDTPTTRFPSRGGSGTRRPSGRTSTPAERFSTGRRGSTTTSGTSVRCNSMLSSARLTCGPIRSTLC